MSRKDYTAIADIIRTANNRYRGSNDALPAISYITLELANYMARDNHKFNEAKFLNASTRPISARDEYEIETED